MSQQLLEHKHYLGATTTFEMVTKSGEQSVDILKTFFVNDKVNGNLWQTPWDGIVKDAPDIVGVPLVLQDDLEHPEFSVQDNFVVGTIIDYELDHINKKMDVYVKITDKRTVERIKSGELEFVSPALVARGEENLEEIAGIDVVNRSIPVHLAIVANPAYGKIEGKMKHLCSGPGKSCMDRLRIMKASVDPAVMAQWIANNYTEERLTAVMAKQSEEDKQCMSTQMTHLDRTEPGASHKQKIAIALSKCGLSKKSASDLLGQPDMAKQKMAPLTQTPILNMVKKLERKLARTASEIQKIERGTPFHEFDGVVGNWITANGMDVFVARNQKIEKAIAEQCPCSANSL